MDSDWDSIYSISTIATTADYPSRRNILIVGDTGVGKSALVNLIAGEDQATTSSCSRSCTLHSQEYTVILDGVEYSLHDTTGLHDSQENMENAEYLDVLCRAATLISRLERSGGISLLVFCMMGGRISPTMRQTYDLFVEALCNRQVPVVIVVTSLEMYNNMDEWWGENERDLKRCGFMSLGHACITTTRGYKNIFSDKYDQSREIIRKLLLNYGNQVIWKEEMAKLVQRMVLYVRTWRSFSAEDVELVAREVSERLWEISENVLEEEILAGYFKHNDISSCCMSLYPGMID